jgi:hypothetical protein
VEIAHIRDGIHAHQRGHDWLRLGQPDVALRHFQLGSFHGLAVAEEDAAALDESGGTGIARCPSDAAPTAHRPWQRRPWLVPAAATLLALVATIFLNGWLARPAPAPPSVPQAGLLQLPTALPDGKQGSRLALDLGTGGSAGPAEPAPGDTTETPSPRPSESRPAAPAAPSSPAAELTPSSDPHYSFSREDGAESFTALVFTDDTEQWRRLRLHATPGSEFQATLWSIGRAPCLWRFVGLDSAAPGAIETTTGEVRVAAGERRYTTLVLRDWPILSVEVRGGEQAAGCLLVNQRIVRATPSPAASPSQENAEVQPSPSPSESAAASPSPERTADPAARAN